MLNARQYLNKGQQAAVVEAIALAETRTRAEVVCACATESGRYDRAESLAGLLFALLALAMANAALVDGGSDAGSWKRAATLPFSWQCLAVVAGFVVGSLAASYWHPLRRLFTSQSGFPRPRAGRGT